MNDGRRILIIGAGLAGSCLLVALRRLGMEADLVERRNGWPEEGSGIYLLGNAMRVLADIGLDREVLRLGQKIGAQTLRTASGWKLANIKTENVWGKIGPCVALSRSELQQVFARALVAAGVRFSTSVVAIDQSDDSVAVRLSDGEVRSYDLVVAADGVRSPTRHILFPDTKLGFCGQVCWRFIVRCPRQITEWTGFNGDDGVFLFIPIGSGLTYCYADAIVHEPIADPPEGRLERLKERFKSYAGPVQEALKNLTSPDQVHFSAIEDILQEPCWSGRVVLIGDAAHATSPNMASGAAMAFEDAYVLSRLLAEGVAMTDIGAAYEEQRAPRVKWVQEQTRVRDRARRLPRLVREPLVVAMAKRLYVANYRPLLTPI